MKFPAAQDFHVDLDKYINRFIPPSQLYRLPKPISRFLGYRDSPEEEVGNVLVCVWSFIGAFCGIILVVGVFQSSSVIQSYHPPLVVASLGATAILDYQTIQSPLAQPRNSIFGHALSAVVGVAVTKLFMLSPRFESLRWIAGALGCGLASTVMGMTNTVHPPGGATALLAAVDPAVRNLGWMFIPLVVLGSLLMLLCALVINNIQRQFPLFWWTPRDVGPQKEPDIEKASQVKEDSLERQMSRAGGFAGENTIIITADRVVLPNDFILGSEEIGVLEILRNRLRDHEYPGHLPRLSSTASRTRSRA